MTTQIDVQLTPQQSLAFAWRSFDVPVVEDIGLKPGTTFRAWTIKPANTAVGFEFAEFLARSPEIAVEQLAQMIVRQA